MRHPERSRLALIPQNMALIRLLINSQLPTIAASKNNKSSNSGEI